MYSTSSSKRPQRGAASIEAVIALPIFVVLFVGVIFLRDLVGAKLQVEQQARRCAWEFSENGCETVPPGCDGFVHTNRDGDVAPNVSSAWEDGTRRLSGGDFQQAILNALADTVLDGLAKAFTQTLDANNSVERDRPALFGGDKATVTGSYHLACNLKVRTREDIVNRVWDFLVP